MSDVVVEIKGFEVAITIVPSGKLLTSFHLNDIDQVHLHTRFEYLGPYNILSLTLNTGETFDVIEWDSGARDLFKTLESELEIEIAPRTGPGPHRLYSRARVEEGED